MSRPSRLAILERRGPVLSARDMTTSELEARVRKWFGRDPTDAELEMLVGMTEYEADAYAAQQRQTR